MEVPGTASSRASGSFAIKPDSQMSSFLSYSVSGAFEVSNHLPILWRFQNFVAIYSHLSGFILLKKLKFPLILMGFQGGAVVNDHM